MGTQFNRVCKVQIDTNALGSLVLTDLKMVFKITQSDTMTPTMCNIRIFNLSKDTVNTIISNGTILTLTAGYAPANEPVDEGVIFSGFIRYYKYGALDAINSYVDIYAATSDATFNYQAVSLNIPAGTTGRKVLDMVNASAKATGASIRDYTASAPPNPVLTGVLPRGKVFYGTYGRVYRDLVNDYGISVSSSLNGTIDIVYKNGYSVDSGVALTPATGLIGVPEQTADGIKATCLLNHRLVPTCLVKIDQSLIAQYASGAATNDVSKYNQGIIAGLAPSQSQQLAVVNKQGNYRAYVVEHRGDTRGEEWYTDIICLSMDDKLQVIAQ
jgi:hypothetical protein